MEIISSLCLKMTKNVVVVVVVDRAYAFVKLKAEVLTKKDFTVNAGIKLLFRW